MVFKDLLCALVWLVNSLQWPHGETGLPSHFTREETEAETGEVTCPRSCSSLEQIQASLWTVGLFLNTLLFLFPHARGSRCKLFPSAVWTLPGVFYSKAEPWAIPWTRRTGHQWLDVGPVGWVLPKMSNVWGFWSGWLMPLTEVGFVYFLHPSMLSLVHSLFFLNCDIWHVSYHSDSQVWMSSGIFPSDI